MSLLDRRRYPRFPFHSRAAIKVDGCHYQGTLMDISAKGCLFVTDASVRFPVGNPCHVFVLHAPTRKSPSLGGTLAHTHEHLLGIEFTDIGDEGHEALHQIIEMNLAPANLLERELPALLRSSETAVR
jgi:hypothetical protein